jgi:peptidoglycan/xylan/chitin deacetylase (PgdA/CDA1 family)
MYHRIADVPEQQDRHRLAVSPEEFARQMGYLHRAGYSCLPLSEVVRGSSAKQRRGSRCFALTFDDGYADFYTSAYPILHRYGFTATIFLVAERVGLRSDWEGQKDGAAADLLSWKEIRQLARWGIGFGSHTLTHPRLTRLNAQEADHEIADSKALIEEQLGRRIDLFSYPFGASNARLQEIVSENGYAAAFGVDRGRYGCFHQWRTQCQSHESFWSFYWKTHGGYQRVVWLREQSPLGRPLRSVIRAFRRGAASGIQMQAGDSPANRGMVDD